MAEKEGKVVDDPIGKAFSKVGITGIASAILTLIFGILVLWAGEWEHFKWIIGLYLIIVGILNLVGYISSIASKNRAARTYVETETLRTKE